MTGSKLTWHFQTLSSSAAIQEAERAGVEYVKVMDPPTENPFPSEMKVVGRGFMPDSEFNQMVWDGAIQQWLDRWMAYFHARPWVYAWEVGNEPHPMWNLHFVERLVTFTMGVSTAMHNHGLRMVGLNLSVGWPLLGHFGDPAPRAARLRPAVERLAQNGHFLGLHEYSAPAMWDSERAYCLRYRHTMQEIGVEVPLLITECGIDGGVIGQGGKAWKTFCKTGPSGTAIEKYLAQLQWYDRRLQEDSYVEAAFIFNAGGYPEWQDFELGPDMSHALADYIRSVPETSDPEPNPPDTGVGGLLDEAMDLIGQSRGLLGG